MEHWKFAKVKITTKCHLEPSSSRFTRIKNNILAIESLPVLEKLNLNGNQFGDEGCEKLISQMGSSNIGHKLDSLDEDNEPDDDDDEDEEPLRNLGTLSMTVFLVTIRFL